MASSIAKEFLDGRSIGSGKSLQKGPKARTLGARARLRNILSTSIIYVFMDIVLFYCVYIVQYKQCMGIINLILNLILH